MGLVLIVAQCAAAAFLHRGPALTALGDAFPCVLAVLVVLAFRSNRRQSSGAVRLFWMLNEAGFAILFLSQLVWFYYEVLRHQAAPSAIAGDGLFLLALLPTLGALTLNAHGESAVADLRYRRIDFLLLVSWWICLYCYFALPWQVVVTNYPNYNPAYYVLALGEHFTVLVAVASLYLKSEGAWKAFYRLFFVALCVFTLGSLLQSIAIARSWYYTGSGYDLPAGFSLLLLMCAAAFGGKLQSQPSSKEVVSRRRGSWSARFALIGVISLPLLAAFTFFDRHNPHAIVLFRLRLIFTAVLFLGALTFLKLATMDRELLRLIASKESSLEALKKVQTQILESQRMAALGRLASGATHEISNPLTAILGYAQLLRDSATLTPEDRNSVADIHEQVHRAQSAINGMRKFVRAENGVAKSAAIEPKTH
jgi:hypothetical protein